MLRPLTRATAPPNLSATSPSRLLSPGSAAAPDGVSVNSSRVPSTSRNKHQSSDGAGGAFFVMQKHSLPRGKCQCPKGFNFHGILSRRHTRSGTESTCGGTVFRSVILRFVLPVALASCVVAYFGLPYIERLLAEWFRADVELRAQLAMHSMEEPIAELVGEGNQSHLRNYLVKVTADERLLAVLVCRPDGTTIVKTERTPIAISCESTGMTGPAVTRIVQRPSGSGQESRFDFDARRFRFGCSCCTT